jgi:hypothetical protein
MYKRLVTFGCSNTYGQGLKDCSEPDLRAGPLPSKFAWPQLLANHLKLECVNMSEPGASNKQLWWKTVNFEFEPTDLVIYAATFVNRELVLEDDTDDYKNIGMWKDIASPKRSKMFMKWVALSNSNKLWEYQSYVHLDHAYQHALRQGAKTVLHYKHREDTYEHDLPDWVTFKWQNEALFKRAIPDDRTLCGHSGHKSHVLIALQVKRLIKRLMSEN